MGGQEARPLKRNREVQQEGEGHERRRREVAGGCQSEPKPPLVPQLIYTDATMEALAYGLARGWPSAWWKSVERSRVGLGAHSMGRKRSCAPWRLEHVLGWGVDADSSRTAGGSCWLKNARLTMNLQVQPGRSLGLPPE